MDDLEYTESAIGIVEEARPDSANGEAQLLLNGQYVAVCAKQRCGYTRESYLL